MYFFKKKLNSEQTTVGTGFAQQSHCLNFFSLNNSSEIVFLRTTVPAYGSYNFGSYDVKFDILEGNVDNAFDIIKRVENGLYVGEYRVFFACLGEPIAHSDKSDFNV